MYREAPRSGGEKTSKLGSSTNINGATKSCIHTAYYVHNTRSRNRNKTRMMTLRWSLIIAFSRLLIRTRVWGRRIFDGARAADVSIPRNFFFFFCIRRNQPACLLAVCQPIMSAIGCCPSESFPNILFSTKVRRQKA